MNSPQIMIALLAAGISLTLGLVTFFSGLHKDGDKTDLIFGIMCICIFIFFVSPPVGFIMIDQAPYSREIITKRIFNFSFLSLLPWFVNFYTGYKKKIFALLIDGLTLFSYLLMAFTAKESNAPLWLSVLLIPIGLSLVHGFLALRYQFRSGAKNKAIWLLFAMVILLLLYLPTAIQHVWNNYFSSILHAKIFFPVNLFPLALIIIMGTRLRGNTIARVKLEKALGLKNMQWNSLLEHIELIIVHLDNQGKVIYINPYGVSLLHYNDASEIVQKNWFEYFLPGPEVGIIKGLFQKGVNEGQINPQYKNSVICKDGIEKIITWTNEIIYDTEGAVTGVMSIGSDITDQEKAFLQIQELKAELEKENLLLKGEPLPDWMHQEIIGRSQAITYSIQKAKQVAPTQASVLLEGETGVGKELFADLIQRTSLRNNKPFVKVNCGALPAELVEDELFGHEKGAFTGAIQARKGRFELANGGTIFLDEIGQLPLALQPKLLRVLQNGEFERIGGQQTISVDVRVIAANNKPLEMEVKHGRFRDDLFYRLNVFPITIPALKNRKEDIPLLVQFFIDKKAKKHGKTFENISKADLNHLCEYDWPGNIRELKNVIERSVIASENNRLKLDWFYHGVKKTEHSNAPFSLELIEKEHILKILNECQWRIGGNDGAAEKLDMHPSTLRSKMKKLNISRPSAF